MTGALRPQLRAWVRYDRIPLFGGFLLLTVLFALLLSFEHRNDAMLDEANAHLHAALVASEALGLMGSVDSRLARHRADPSTAAGTTADWALLAERIQDLLKPGAELPPAAAAATARLRDQWRQFNRETDGLPQRRAGAEAAFAAWRPGLALSLRQLQRLHYFAYQSGLQGWSRWRQVTIWRLSALLFTILAFGSLAVMWSRWRLRGFSQRHDADQRILAEREDLLRFVLDGAFDGIFMADAEHGRLVYGNVAMGRLLGVPPAQLPGVRIADVLPAAVLQHPGQSTPSTTGPADASALDVPLQARDGTPSFVNISSSVIARDGTPHYIGVVRDVTGRVQAEQAVRAALAEREVLLREIHHRVKNNLQVVSSLLYFHAKRAVDPVARAAFDEARARLRSMILVHEQLYASTDLAYVEFDRYLRTLVDQMSHAGSVSHPIAFALDAQPVRLSIETAVPAGMIVVELVSNVLKYAYPLGDGGTAAISLSRDGNRVALRVADAGPGLPAGFDPALATTFGWQLIHTLVRQLDGTVDIASLPGTSVLVSFPAPLHMPSPITNA